MSHPTSSNLHHVVVASCARSDLSQTGRLGPPGLVGSPRPQLDNCCKQRQSSDTSCIFGFPFHTRLFNLLHHEKRIDTLVNSRLHGSADWALISLALANLSHPAQVSMKDHESLQTSSTSKLHQVIIQVSEELNRPNHSPRSPRARGSGSCESGASTNKAGPSYFSGLGTTHLESSLWWAICDAMIFY